MSWIFERGALHVASELCQADRGASCQVPLTLKLGTSVCSKPCKVRVGKFRRLKGPKLTKALNAALSWKIVSLLPRYSRILRFHLIELLRERLGRRHKCGLRTVKPRSWACSIAKSILELLSVASSRPRPRPRPSQFQVFLKCQKASVAASLKLGLKIGTEKAASPLASPLIL